MVAQLKLTCWEGHVHTKAGATVVHSESTCLEGTCAIQSKKNQVHHSTGHELKIDAPGKDLALQSGGYQVLRGIVLHGYVKLFYRRHCHGLRWNMFNL